MPLAKFGAKTGKKGVVSTPVVAQVAASKDNRKQQTIRLSPAQWRRVKDFALDENATFQEIAVRGISWLMEDRGLPPLED